MAYNESVAEKIRIALADSSKIVEKKMFGGLCFMVRGNMAIGVVGDELMVRVGPEQQPIALKKPHARVMDFTGKPMVGFIYVAAEGLKSLPSVRSWVQLALNFNAGLPEKQGKPNKANTPTLKNPKTPTAKKTSKPSSKKAHHAR
jgi:TfoX/Sxy family transcriptional regulator of competence genes